MSENSSHEKLRVEIESLRHQLEDANETLRAIRKGEVDALVVSTDQGEQVFTLKGAEATYRLMIEEMNEGAIVLSQEDCILYCNARFAHMVKASLDEVIGVDIHKFLPVNDTRFREMIQQGGLDKGNINAELTFLRKDGTFFPASVSLTPFPVDKMSTTFLVVTDLTEHKEQERLVSVGLEARANERQRLYSVLETLPAYVILLDKDYRIPFANKFFRERFGESQGKRCFEYLFNRNEACENCETYKVMKANTPHRWDWLGPDGRMYDVYDFPFIEADGSKLILEMGIDVTERKQTEIAVKAEQKRLYDVLETLPTMVCLLTPDYHVAFANRSFRERFGESGGRHCYEYCYGYLEPCDFCESYKVLQTGKPHHWELTTSDQHIIDVFDFPFTDASGSDMILEMDLDVTEQRRLQESLQSSSLYARNLIEASLDPVVTISPQGKITDVNRATELVIGAPRNQLIGSDFSKYFTEPDNAMAGYQQVLREGFVKDYPLTIQNTSGRTIDVLYNATTYMDEKGKILGVFAAARDITGRKKAEKQIREQAELLNIAHDAILVRDLEQRITFWNKGAEHLYGWTAQEAIGKKANELLYRDSSEYLVADKTVLEKGEWDGELEQFSKTGRDLIVQSRWNLVRDEIGNPKSILVIHSDITDQKIVETKLKDSERYAAIGQTAGMVGHDIRNPLQSIEGAIYLGKNSVENLTISEAEKATVNEMFDAIEDQIHYINKIVSDLQDFARPLTPTLKETDPRQLIESGFANVPFSPDVEVSTIIDDDTLRFKVDPEMMRRVLVNLITNSLQAMPHGGKLTLKVFEKNGSGYISIQDTGVGIPDSAKPQLFQPMFTTKAKGQGFGLAVCKRIVEAHHGEITFDSEVGKGTVFTIHLPVL